MRHYVCDVLRVPLHSSTLQSRRSVSVLWSEVAPVSVCALLRAVDLSAHCLTWRSDAEAAPQVERQCTSSHLTFPTCADRESVPEQHSLLSGRYVSIFRRAP